MLIATSVAMQGRAAARRMASSARASAMARHKLITIGPSHYCEKARWALDYFKQPFKNHGCLPGLHMPLVRYQMGSRGKADGVSSKYSTPCLAFPDGSSINDSSLILRRLDAEHAGKDGMPATLYPAHLRAEIEELEEHYHSRLGPHTRRVAYFHGFQRPDLLTQLFSSTVGPFQSAITGAYVPILKRFVGSGLGITPERTDKSIGYIRAEFDRAAQRLRDNGTGFLVGDRFTAADLSFATMASLALLVTAEEGYGVYMPTAAEVGGRWGALAQELRAHEAGKHALDMFRRFRPPSSIHKVDRGEKREEEPPQTARL